MKKQQKKSPMKVAFLDRDGTLIFEPPVTEQVNGPEQLRILPGVVEGLKKLIAEGFALVMVTNQDGLGSRSYPQKNFDAVQGALFKRLKKEGVQFYRIFICPHFPKEKCACRKPKVGLLKGFLKKASVDRGASIVVGDHDSDEEFAKNIGIRFYRMETNGAFPRFASLKRETKETAILAECNLDGTGAFSISTGLRFFDHMLEQFSKHSLIDLRIKAKGDLDIDDHHTIEDVGLALGETLKNALGERRGIKRYGFLLPMDDVLVECAVDLGGRPYLAFNASFKREKVGDLPTEMVEHFFRSVAETLKANIHINVKYGTNEHHKIEAIFKAFAKAMKDAVALDPRRKNELPTTKGVL
ncbi:hypothetical protein A3C21_01440 [Candidatus Kaiserbacteria bacterium RIFCSPHIGHO2_02_FULL_59_21]|uniref:Imidazoleglycerol-phosphate dehydratase n=1 Tax=Candidatus Kaiserbacteria bacterium RIFCSPHIGHO2_02_FULL_59_21 TaxID=1798500 RepID=A0A1F6E1K1_9BACT|nr:MAG: hypothetical protein A2766_00730 [Candidatus Kaiserbacteria bacterium RIFCSPHIGHO2_01_FULL_58_22]OGG67533.1 MAG: hypothetical protein A3C21_01440 [Candidatus Kaiserbacteria bacterium RIFCSPHIGHO2_02_FULL_59_21]OGG80137.1 MAG: hypothetical protein A2952_03570 [Candidatus Kaiserbacteria bacterium RIFCSPLOWO2_01_FULL_59_34]OGG86928.1 MAG: hypothetical protein A3I47_02960 [Candidatus Kaiserbacteria bacterium RIFCSPLOWO2_02_FULL_59_19]